MLSPFNSGFSHFNFNEMRKVNFSCGQRHIRFQIEKHLFFYLSIFFFFADFIFLHLLRIRSDQTTWQFSKAILTLSRFGSFVTESVNETTIVCNQFHLEYDIGVKVMRMVALLMAFSWFSFYCFNLMSLLAFLFLPENLNDDWWPRSIAAFRWAQWFN